MVMPQDMGGDIFNLALSRDYLKPVTTSTKAFRASSDIDRLNIGTAFRK
jgi:hypothetical protein